MFVSWSFRGHVIVLGMLFVCMNFMAVSPLTTTSSGDTANSGPVNRDKDHPYNGTMLTVSQLQRHSYFGGHCTCPPL